MSPFQITLHVAYVHAFVNPTLFLVLHRGLRQAALDLCCGCCTQCSVWLLNMTSSNSSSSSTGMAGYRQTAPTMLPPPPQPPATSIGDISLLKPPLPPANNKPQLVNSTCINATRMAWHSMHAVPCFAHVHSDVTVPWCNFSQITELCAVYQMATPVRSRV